MLVRENPKKKGHPQVVLLDHGLYKGELVKKGKCKGESEMS